MRKNRRMVVVGGGLAGASAVVTMREQGFTGEVVLIGADSHAPYELPPLTKQFLAGASTADDALVRPLAFYSDHDIELRVGTEAVSLDVAGHAVVLADGSRVAYDAVLVASGAEPRRLTVDGADLDGVVTLRTLNDAADLRDRLLAGARVVCAGAGWIGMEAAATARSLGCDVTVVGREDVPLIATLGPEVGRSYRRLHEAHGVQFRMQRNVDYFRGSQRVESVVLDDGDVLEADVVITGVGAAPRTSLLADAGATLELRGVATDERLRTNLPDVFAAGDIAASWHPLFQQRIRLEHWANALYQGPCAAMNMIGGDAVYDRIPYFYSDQFDRSMEYSGHAPEWDRIVLRGSIDDEAFLAFWLDANDVMLAGMSVGPLGTTAAAIPDMEELVRLRQPVDMEKVITAPSTTIATPAARAT